MSGPGNSRSRSVGGGFGLVLLLMLAVSITPPSTSTSTARAAGLGWSRVDPAQVVPLDQIPAEFRESVSEVIRDHTFHRQGDAESFPCNAGLYMSLVNEPSITLALWKDLAESPVQVKRIGPNRYQGEDGSGSTATWDFVLRTPKVHVLLAYLSYVSPRGNAKIDARIVLVLHTGYYREVNREPYVQHDVEAFVKVDSKGWKTLARTVRPVIERVLEDQVREAGQFVSLMSRLVVMYPTWATDVAMKQNEADEPARERFREIVAQNRKPNASDGRPVVMANPNEATADTRRR
ncbi:MAG: hypothetical protein P4L85_24610 [Paludisphaera borealis]|uniref:hypothetical protein n=1 Tax=Paludisphaera borealis TaxID=1387353 RepID=UPI002850D531|nr:hypothetical protein [Paludisphaera borealis]MDR3622556.1 hypothetical protein [Paludisphaera borealis]